MERNFSQHVKEILGYSREEAERLQNSNIVPEHLLLGIIRDESCCRCIGRARSFPPNTEKFIGK